MARASLPSIPRSSAKAAGAWLAALHKLKAEAVPVDHQAFARAEAENAAMLADNLLAESIGARIGETGVAAYIGLRLQSR